MMLGDFPAISSFYFGLASALTVQGLGDDDNDVFQPDLVVICDRDKIDDEGCNEK